MEADKELKSIINSGRIPNAFLFEGPSGSGKLKSAIGFAQSLFMLNSSTNNLNTNFSTNLAHPDFHIIFPIPNSEKKAENSCDFYCKDWIEYAEGLVSSNSLVIMLDNHFAPKLGSELPAKLSDLSIIENVLSKYGVAEFNPVFSNHNSFNQTHYDFHLHQYYKIEFNQSIDIFSLMNDLKQITIIKNVELNYNS